jgi:mono/diheme cytochrome c family protein
LPLTATVLLAAKKSGVSGQQKLSLAFVAVILVGWAAYLVYALTRRDPAEPVGSEMETAPNRKSYFEDDELESNRLDRALLFSLVMLVVIAVGLPLYWLTIPARQKGAQFGFDKRSAQRGELLFASAKDTRTGLHFGCADCHGAKGVGGSAKFFISDTAHPEIPPHQVAWTAPPLNSVLLRFSSATTSDPNANVGTAADAVRTIIVYGRAGTPMPAWGLAGGGPMDDQQINDIVQYLGTIQLSNADAAKYWADQAGAAAVQEGKVDVLGKPIIDGQILFDTNCARCHTKGYSYGEAEVPGGGGQYAPNITNGSEVRQFPNIKDQIDFVTNGVAFGQGYGTGGIGQTAGGGMPHFGNYLTQDQIDQIVAYERSL